MKVQHTNETPVLQVALDILNGDRALQIAKEAVKGGADWLEVGTPLIKSEGMEIVRKIKRTFPKHILVADMKTIDVGGLEVEMAAKAGANIVCIMGVSSDITISDALKSAAKYNAKIMIDLLGISDVIKRASEVCELGVDYLCIHVGIDEQMSGTGLKNLKRTISNLPLPVAVAGGLNSETVANMVRAGASIIIVGGAIIKSPDVTSATRTIKRAMHLQKSIPTSLYKKYDERHLFIAFSKVSSSNVSDAMHMRGGMINLKPILGKVKKLVGKALTVRTVDGDWAKPVEAIDIAEKGSVIVIDAGGGTTAVWGELASWSCKKKGIAGAVIDGAVRDVQDILKMDLPVFAKHISPHCGEPKGYGEIGGEIKCCGQTVRTDDWIIGDESGVTVVPREIAVEIANRALDVLERENRLRAEIKRGSTLSKLIELYKWEKVG